MILTETYFRKISVLMLPKESQALEETLAEAQSVLKQAHSKGVELECILEVRELTISFLLKAYRFSGPDKKNDIDLKGSLTVLLILHVSNLKGIDVYELGGYFCLKSKAKEA